MLLLQKYSDKKDHILDQALVPGTMSDFGPSLKRSRMTPPLNERVMLYVRQENEDVYTPLHVVPPTTMGLLNAVSSDLYYSTFFPNFPMHSFCQLRKKIV